MPHLCNRCSRKDHVTNIYCAYNIKDCIFRSQAGLMKCSKLFCHQSSSQDFLARGVTFDQIAWCQVWASDGCGTVSTIKKVPNSAPLIPVLNRAILKAVFGSEGCIPNGRKFRGRLRPLIRRLHGQVRFPWNMPMRRQDFAIDSAYMGVSRNRRPLKWPVSFCFHALPLYKHPNMGCVFFWEAPQIVGCPLPLLPFVTCTFRHWTTSLPRLAFCSDK